MERTIDGNVGAFQCFFQFILEVVGFLLAGGCPVIERFSENVVEFIVCDGVVFRFQKVIQ